MTNLDIIWKNVVMLLTNLQFYVAVGTISMAVTTAWSVRRNGKLDEVRDLKERINSFYLPFFEVFSHKWNDEEFKDAWNRIRPFIRNASIKTQKALFDGGIYGKSPKLLYNEDDADEKKEYEAWDKLYQVAWEDFWDLDSELMRLQRKPRTKPPDDPIAHNFEQRKIKGRNVQENEVV